MSTQARSLLKRLFLHGVNAVSGKGAVHDFLSLNKLESPDAIFAVGKAACAMYQGVPADLRDNADVLIVTKEGHITGNFPKNERVHLIESAHPIPNEISLEAGRAAVDFVSSLPEGSSLLTLVSGGASALVEVLQDGYDLHKLVELNEQYLSRAADIETINKQRSVLSKIKQGRLLSKFSGRSVTTLAISDVQGDDIKVIGSGIGAANDPGFHYNSHIVASNETARCAIMEEALKVNLAVNHNDEALYLDLYAAADHIHHVVSKGPKGLYIFGGEPTVDLPKKPGRGGRNQALGLLLAKHFSGAENISCLTAGTDGTDGPTNAAGAIVDGFTYKKPAAERALKAANSGVYLEQSGNLLVTGPTGTNVMDVALILKT